jgi:excisionase family DNA binding protein
MTVLRLIASNKLIAHKVGHRLIRIYEEDYNSFVKGTTMGDGATKTNNNEKNI